MISAPVSPPRKPFADPEQETLRKLSYWNYLSKRHEQNLLVDQAARVGPPMPDQGWYWVRLRTPEDADYEAFHMEHSIGHSWDKYSGMGKIYSLRDPAGVPQVTALVCDDVIVHAREKGNARLSPANMERMRLFAETREWTIKAEKFPFDAVDDEPGRFTGPSGVEVVYLVRDAQNRKIFHEEVLSSINELEPGPEGPVEAMKEMAGRLMIKVPSVRLGLLDLTREMVADSINSGAVFQPELAGMKSLSPDLPHEIQAIRAVSSAPTVSGSIFSLLMAFSRPGKEVEVEKVSAEEGIEP